MFRTIFLIIFILIYYCCGTFAQDVDCQVSVETLSSHVGDTVVFCGQATDVAKPSGVKGNPVFLNFGGRHPNHKLTVDICENGL